MTPHLKKKIPISRSTLGCVNEGKQISADTMSWRENQMRGWVLSLDHSLPRAASGIAHFSFALANNLIKKMAVITLIDGEETCLV